MARVSGTVGGTPIRSEADDATRGSAVRLAAEVASRLLLFATTLLLSRWLGPTDYGLFAKLSAYALLLAEVGELGLQVLASRVLVAGSVSLRSLVRARLALAGLVALVVAAAVLLAPLAWRLLGDAATAGTAGAPVGLLLALLVLWFALSGWGEFLGVALRCRRARRLEALVLLALRAVALALTLAALLAGAGLGGVALGLAVSPVPAIALGAWLLRRTPAAPAPEAAPAAVLRQSAPLAVYAALLLLSPRVEFFVLTFLRPDREVGLFAAALLPVWFLAMVPGAITAGAMPALTREALDAGRAGEVRRRTSGTLALLGVAAAVGLALLAAPVAVLLVRSGSSAEDYAGAAAPLRVMAAAVPAMFLNALVAAALNACGRAGWLPRLILARVLAAFGLAAVLVPGFGGAGAAAGLVCAEWLLLAVGTAASRRAGFAVPVVAPLAAAVAAALPMAFAVAGVREHLVGAVALGALTWAATLFAALRLAPTLVRGVIGDVRYP
jgi:O-antigen/teichoic acid export membrane protein